MKLSLFKRSPSGQILVWKAKVKGKAIHCQWGKLNGKMQVQTKPISKNMSGRSIEEQTKLQFNSLVSKKKDKGYIEDIELAKRDMPTNTAGLPLPMAAQTEKSPYRKTINNGMMLQPKLNGHRCFIRLIGGKAEAFSKSGKPIETVPHVLKLLKKHAKKELILDGELYIHGESIQEISSAVKRKSKKSKRLIFVCFDIIDERQYVDRLQNVAKLWMKLNKPKSFIPIHLIGSKPFRKLIRKFNSTKSAKRNFVDIDIALQTAIDSKFEGLISRDLNTKYEAGKRVSTMLKIKRFYDQEYIVEDITEDKNGYGILHLKHEERKFTVTAPGKQDDKWDAADNPAEFIGRKVTVKYSEITNKGVPFHPVAVCWKDDE